MKRLLLLISIFCSITLLSSAQVTINNSVIPSVGDSLQRMQDNQPTGISIGISGANQYWDFSGVQGPFIITTVIRDADEGSKSGEFPQANILVSEGNIESYFIANQTDYSLAGVSAPFPELQIDNVVGKYSPPLTTISTPISYQGTSSQTSNFRVTFSSMELPDAILEQLPLQPDSLRLNQTNTVTTNADAWGTLRLPLGEYQVLRVRRQVNITTRIEALLPLVGWFDITQAAEGIAGELLEDQENISYEFYSNNIVGPVAVVSMDTENSNEIDNVNFLGNMTTSVRYRDNGRADAYAYPNPSMGYLRIQMVNMPEDTYSINVYNILGKEIYKKNNIRASGSKIIELSLYDQPKGTYLYSIKNSRGQNLMSKRFILIKP